MIGQKATKIKRASLRAIEKFKAKIQQKLCPFCNGQIKVKVAVEVETAIDGLQTSHYNKRFTYIKCLGKNSRRKKCNKGKWWRLAFSPHSKPLNEVEAQALVENPFEDPDQVQESSIIMPPKPRILRP